MSASERSPDRLRFSWYAAQECLRSALSSIRAHGLRSSLTMLGIVIGVASVICVIALVQGLSQSISNQLQGLGGSTLTLRSHTPFEDQLRGKRNRLRLQDLEELRFRIDGISKPIVAVGVSDTGIDFDAPDDKLAHIVFLILTPASDPEAQLEITAGLARLFREYGMTERVLKTKSYTEFLALMKSLSVETEPA